MHHVGGVILRRKTAGAQHHQPLRHRIHAQREDHRGHAQIGDAEAADQAHRHAAENAEGMASASPSGPQPAAAVDIMPPTVTTHGTERSICPSRTTSIMPVAIRPRKDATCNCCSRYSGEKARGIEAAHQQQHDDAAERRQNRLVETFEEGWQGRGHDVVSRKDRGGF